VVAALSVALIVSSFWWVWRTVRPSRVVAQVAGTNAVSARLPPPKPLPQDGPVLAETMSSEQVREALAPRLREAMVAAGYTEDRIEALNERFSEFLTIQARGTWEEYKAMLIRWGGRMKYESLDPKYHAEVDASLKNLWRGADDPGAMHEYFLGGTRVRTYDRVKVGGGLAKETIPTGLTANTGFCAASFPEDPAVLRRGVADMIQLSCSAKDRSGQEVTWYWSFVWSPKQEAWVPLMVVTMAPQRYPIASPKF